MNTGYNINRGMLSSSRMEIVLWRNQTEKPPRPQCTTRDPRVVKHSMRTTTRWNAPGRCNHTSTKQNFTKMCITDSHQIKNQNESLEVLVVLMQQNMKRKFTNNFLKKDWKNETNVISRIETRNDAERSKICTRTRKRHQWKRSSRLAIPDQTY